MPFSPLLWEEEQNREEHESQSGQYLYTFDKTGEQHLEGNIYQSLCSLFIFFFNHVLEIMCLNSVLGWLQDVLNPRSYRYHKTLGTT